MNHLRFADLRFGDPVRSSRGLADVLPAVGLLGILLGILPGIHLDTISDFRLDSPDWGKRHAVGAELVVVVQPFPLVACLVQTWGPRMLRTGCLENWHLAAAQVETAGVESYSDLAPQRS